MMVHPLLWKTVQCLPAMTYYIVSSGWIPPLCEAGTTVVYMADSLRVTPALGLMAEVRTGDRSKAKRTATEPVKLETKPTNSDSRERGSQHW